MALTRRNLFRQVVGALAVAAAPIVAGTTLASRLITQGLSMPTWRLVQQRMGGEMFSTYTPAAARVTGYLGWFEDKGGRVVGWLRADGALLRLTRNGRYRAQQAPTGRAHDAFEATQPGHARWYERIGSAIPMDTRNPVNW